MKKQHVQTSNQNDKLHAENQLFHLIRTALINDEPIETIPELLSFSYNPKISKVALSLFQPEIKSIRYTSRKKTFSDSLNYIVSRLKKNKSFDQFRLFDSAKSRILLEIVIEESQCDINQLKHSASKNSYCFEPGIHGLKFSYPGKSGYFMPTDAVVKNINAVNDILLLLSRRTYIADKTRKKNARIQLMKSEPIEYKLIKTVAFISYHNNVLPLYKGYPLPLKTFNQDYLFSSVIDSINWLVKNCNTQGKFTYFYDGITDSNADIDHPKNPDYYNMLRHSGAIIGLLSAYQLNQEKSFLTIAEKAINYLLSSFNSEMIEVNGQNKQYSCYPMCNKKAKLGGSGISLIALIQYYLITKQDKLRKFIDGLVRHLLSRIESNGEMLSYYIHPQYNDGNPLVSLTDTEKKSLFSFYYPGEAMLGLALYYRKISQKDPEFKQFIYQKSKLAMDFLIEQRPKKYPELFNRVPDDAWLMQAIEEWLKVDGFKKQSYYDFLYKDATSIVEYMRSREDSPVINIGARSEGVIAAYYAAKENGDVNKAEYFIQNIIQSVKGLRKTQHTKESTFAHLYPEKTIGTFSFRMTNQWIRIDTIQHTACLMARLYQSGEVV